MTLRQAVFSAGRWTTASALLRVLLQFVQTIVLARLLTPADFGVMAVALVILSIFSVIADIGFSQALIHFPLPTRDTLSTLYWLSLGLACLLMLVLDAIAQSLSVLYQQPELFHVILILSPTLPIGAAGQQFRILAEKDLRFRTLAWIEVVAVIAGFSVALVLAIYQAGVYALVVATLTGTLVGSALAWMLLSQDLRPLLRFKLDSVTNYLRYGVYRLGDALLINVNAQMDILVGGAFAGANNMGAYAVPRNQSQMLATSLINPVVTRVLLPVMAKVQNDQNKLKSIYLQALRMTSAINFPLYVALAVWAEEVVSVLLGPQWSEAVWFMRVFAIWGLIRSVGNLTGTLLYSTGKVRLAFWWNLGMLLVIPGLLVAALGAGVRGLALAMLGIQALTFYPLFRLFIQKTCGVDFLEFASVLCPPLFASIVAVALGFAASQSVSGEWPRLVCGGLLAIGIYIALSYAINKSWFMAMRELLGWYRRN